MRTRLLLLLLLLSTISKGQTVTLTSTHLENTFEVKFEDNKKEQIEINIIDSKKDKISNRLLQKEDDPISLINSNIIKEIHKLSADFTYKIPDTDVTLSVGKSMETMTYDDFIDAIKKLEKSKFQNLLKKETTFNSKYKSYLSDIKNVNDTRAVFKDLPSKYIFKKTGDNEYKLFNETAEIKIIDIDSENGFYDILYEEVKDKDDIIKLLLKKEDFDKFKNIDLLTDENTKKLEAAYRKLKGNEKVNDFNYMGYVGTNFDLIDGVKAKNVFFAVNILSKPKREKDKIGFYISLYGNRTLSKNDSIKNIVREYRVYDSVVDNTPQRYSQRQLYDYTKTVSIDNLGAYFSPLFKVGKLSNLDGATQFFLSPSLEFIWRRISIVNNISNVRNETPFLVPGTTEIITQPIDRTPKSYSYNAYDFHLGGGFWIIHENQKISVRLNMNVGWLRSFAPNIENATVVESSELNTDYLKTSDVFYTGKLWITEATTGITLQAEILNTLNTPNPFYGVTLSKAFDFEKLGNFFAPISNRTTGTTK